MLNFHEPDDRAGRAAVEAQYLLLLELVGIGVGKRAVAWADDEIRMTEVPSVELIDLSLVDENDRKSLIWALDAMSRPVRARRRLTEQLLARLDEDLASAAVDPWTVASMLDVFRVHCPMLDEEERWQFCAVSADLEFAQTYGGDVAEAVGRLVQLMKRYRGQQA